MNEALHKEFETTYRACFPIAAELQPNLFRFALDDGEYVEAKVHIAFTLWQAARTTAEQSEPTPIEMVLYCPNCGTQHIDAPDDRTPDWSNPPHRSHLCHECGAIWRPADVATVGVASTQTEGKADTWPDGIPDDARAASAITARDSVIEECATVCENLRDTQWSRTVFYAVASTTCAKAIRALNSQQDAAIESKPVEQSAPVLPMHGSFHTGVLVKLLLDDAFEILRPNSPEDCPEEPWMRVALGKKYWAILTAMPRSIESQRRGDRS